MNKSFHIRTFGCQMNVCDSSWIRHALLDRGWEELSEDRARVVILNTCSVREKPEHKVYSELGRIAPRAEKDPQVFAVVGGCVAQQVGRAFWQRFPFVRLVFGTDGVYRVPQALDRLVEDTQRRTALLDFEDAYPERAGGLPGEIGDGQAFVNIMQGCDNFCAYCIVPYTRGRQKSRDMEAVLHECRTLVDRGAREITLLGQNVNSYGLDKPDGPSFARLLHAVAEVPGLERLRFTTSHPKDIAPEVIDAFGELAVLCPHLHLPVQSGSNRILKVMGRKYTREQYLKRVAALRVARPDISLTTDLIVGFPGETEDDFARTLDLVDQVGFGGGFSFMYSDRPGTRAEKMPGKIEHDIKLARLQCLQKRLEELTAADLAGMVGREVPVLVQGGGIGRRDAGNRLQGRDPAGRIVHFDAPNTQTLAGRLIRVRITACGKHSLSGRATGEPW